MTKATEAFTVRNDAGQLVTFSVGDDVPDDIAVKVGEHVLDVKPDVPEENPLEGLDFQNADEALKAALEIAATQAEQTGEYVKELEDEVEKVTAERDNLRTFKDTILSGNLEDLDLDALRKEDADSNDDKAEGAPDADLFDPSKHGVAKVLEHLEGADEAEDARVRAAEKAGKNRPGIVGNDE